LLLVVSIFPITGNYKFLTVLSGSMEPTIKTGSVVLVQPQKDYKIGDIITFGPTSKTKPPTTHRIYEIKVQAGVPIYLTKGDANNAPDVREIKKTDIIGRVLFDAPYVGYAVSATQNPYGFLLIIIVPAIVIIYDEAQKIWAEVKKKKVAKAVKKEELPPDQTILN
jgi:signal peptidase